MKRSEADILDIHEEPYSVAAAELLLLRWLARSRSLVVVYTAQNLHKPRSLPVRIWERAVLRRAAGAYPCNEEAAALLRRKGYRGLINVLPLGVERNATAVHAIGREGGSAESLMVGFAGRLVPEKGVSVLLEAMAGEADWHLKVAGEGPERGRLAAMATAARLDCDRFELLGSLDEQALSDFYRSIDVLVVPSLPTPSWEEQFCRVAVEAMAAGVPVIASRSGALPEVVGSAGVLVTPGDPVALHEALANLAADPDRRRALGREGVKRAVQYSWEKVAEGQMALYQAVIGGAAGTSGGLKTPEATWDQSVTVSDGDGGGTGIEVVVVAYGRPDLLDVALASVTVNGAPGPVLVVDNSSSPAVREVAERHSARYLDPGTNLGFAGAVNLALAERLDADSDLLLLNPDAEVSAATVRALKGRLHAEARLACVAPRQVGGDGADQRVAWHFPSPLRAWLEAAGLGRLLRSPDFLVGSVLLLHAAAIREVGDFDERFFLYAEETDWQRRARDSGWGTRLCCDLTATHAGGATSDSDPTRREALFAASHELYIRKWYGRGGWASFRAAVVVGALVRAIVLPAPRGKIALQRARRYLYGPSRQARAYLVPEKDNSAGEGTHKPPGEPVTCSRQ